MLPCYACTRQKCVKTCARCKQIYKYNLVLELLSYDHDDLHDKIYLRESTRNKTGRPRTTISDPKIIDSVNVLYNQLHSYRKVASQLGLKKHQVQTIVLSSRNT